MNVRSMTGYGRCNLRFEEAEYSVEIRAVNNRFLDISVRIPKMLAFCEDKIKSEIQKVVSRGKVDVFVYYTIPQGENIQVQPNLSAAKAYADAMAQVDALLGVEESRVDAVSLSRFPEVYTVLHEEANEEEIWNGLQQAVRGALTSFNEMRSAEGEKMEEDCLEKLSNLEAQLAVAEKDADQRVDHYRERLYNKLLQVLDATDIDQKRILEEAAIYADRTAVDEETVRLHTHFGQFRKILDQGGPVGRKLDFLVQEINREINTLGSKASDLQLTQCVLEMKSETEKIREQIQNIE